MKLSPFKIRGKQWELSKHDYKCNRYIKMSLRIKNNLFIFNLHNVLEISEREGILVDHRNASCWSIVE